jgi:hypothetical protein
MNQVDVSASALDEVLRRVSTSPLSLRQWTDVLDGLAKDKDDARALHVLRWMEENEVHPEDCHYSAAALACDRANNWDAVHRLMKEMNDKGIGNLPGWSKRCRNELTQADASEVDAVLERYTMHVSVHRNQWASVLRGLTSGPSRLDKRGLTEGGWTDAQASLVERAVLVLAWMDAKGIEYHADNYAAVLDAFARAGAWDRVHAFIEDMKRSGKGFAGEGSGQVTSLQKPASNNQPATT